MCGIATFTMLVSSSSSTDASDTVIAIRYRYLYRSSKAAPESGIAAAVIARLLGLNRGHGAHAGTQRVRRIGGTVEPDPHGDALHHLREVARRVVGRQQRELRARRGREAL